MADPTERPDPTTPSVLLFGPPGTGKSSLLGALVRAGETQGEVLGAEVIDSTGRLELLRDRVYKGVPVEDTRAEVVVHRVRLRPWRVGGRPVAVPPEVVLLDCDGRAANALLADTEALSDPHVRGGLARAVVACDAIVLLVNAAWGDDELREAFDNFVMFLERVHGRKAFAREVGGFPIAVALTHCDELARPGDDTAKWVARVADRRQYVLDQFAEYLADIQPDPGIQSPYLPFGSVDLRGYAVAVRRPKLAGARNPPDEPYGVAELFRDCFRAASAHRDRAVSSDRSLIRTVWAVGASLWLLLAGLLAVVAFQPTPTAPGLTDRVQAYLLREPPPGVRLAERNIARTKRALTALRNDPAFYALPGELQGFVAGRLKEVEDYQAYREKLSAVMAPAEARSREDLARIEAQLTGELALPPEYAWGETEAARLRAKWLADVPLVRDAEAHWHDWYRDLIRRATGLSLTPSFAGDWRADVGRLFADAARLPFDPSAPIPGSEAVPLPRGGPVEYRVPHEFDRVYQARQDWEFARDRLAHLRDLADALGATAGPDRPDPVLELPEPGPGTDSAALPAARWAELRKLYPRQPVAYPEWELRHFPEPGRSELARRARRSFDAGARHVHRLILAKLGPQPAEQDNPVGWRAVAATLSEPVFRDWGRLLHLLARLSDPKAPDPVEELAAFLRRDRFELDVRGFDLAIPIDLREQRVVPTGPLTITLTPRGGGPPVAQAFKPDGEGARFGSMTVYRFTPEGTGKLNYIPGDRLTAELPVRTGGQEMRLVWDAGGTQTFQFDRLAHEPKLIRPGLPPDRAEGVRLTPTEGSTVPQVPALLPAVQAHP